MTRHNWELIGIRTSDAYHLCVDESRVTAYSARANCYGCGAKIPLDTVWRTDKTRIDLSLDAIWAKELRPMAGMACLIEEADGTS